MKAYISILHNKSSSAIESIIRRSSKSITSSNDTNSSEMSGFGSESNIKTDIHSRIFPNGSLVFDIYGNSQKSITSNETCLTISIADIIILEGLSFDISQKSRFKNIL